MASELKGQFIRIAAIEMKETTTGVSDEQPPVLMMDRPLWSIYLEKLLMNFLKRNISETAEYPIGWPRSVTLNSPITFMF